MTDPQIIETLMRIGKTYQPALLPEGIERGRVGKCFDTCMMAAMRNRNLRYVEGIAMTVAGRDMLDKLKGKWILHSWLTDGEKAYDPTWLAKDPHGNEVPMPTAYIGIEMDIKDVAAFVSNTEYAGVIANRHRNPELAKAAIGMEI